MAYDYSFDLIVNYNSYSIPTKAFEFPRNHVPLSHLLKSFDEVTSLYIALALEITEIMFNIASVLKMLQTY
jgi:hypothetical protein